MLAMNLQSPPAGASHHQHSDPSLIGSPLRPPVTERVLIESMKKICAGIDALTAADIRLERAEQDLQLVARLKSQHKKEVEEARAQLNDARAKLNDERAELNDARTDLNAGKQKASEIEAGIQDTKKGLNETLESAETLRDDAKTYQEQMQKEEQARALRLAELRRRKMEKLAQTLLQTSTSTATT